MVNEDFSSSQNENAESSQGNTPEVPEISQAKRKRLQQLFDHGTLQSNQSNFDYASELLLQCVTGDPGNVNYVQKYLENLKKKYNNNKKGAPMAFFTARGAKNAAKKALQKEDFPSAIKNGLEVLQANPWDADVLVTLASATGHLGFTDSPLAYLKVALEGNPKDPAINKICATTLEELGRITEAYQCWRRISESRPGDEDAERNMARLSVAITINESGYSAASSTPGKKVITKTESGASVEMTHEQFLEKKIRERPKDPDAYLELGEIYTQNEVFEKAVDVLSRGFAACGDINGMRDRLEDVEIRFMRQKLAKVEKKEGRQSEGWKKLRADLNLKELEIWKNRCERYPNNLSFKYDLGLRFQMQKLYQEAIQQFQQAKKEPRRHGVCCLALGQCFQEIKQYRLALSNYKEAIDVIPDRDADNKKKAFYLAGKLALGLKEYDLAEKFLASLADMDFSYRDVSDLLEKLENSKKGN
ncbi:MAG: hypothetical protein Q4C96_01425 [Planctomycetia bacterium]|nr:hypothetical protein [Planctomycetia bacterium]